MVLADHFGRRMASEIGWADWPGFGAEATDALIEYGWPGNVRELRNVIERAVYRWEREGPIDGIEFDPFKSPYRPATRGQADPAAPPAVAAEPDQRGEGAPSTECEAGRADCQSRVHRLQQH